MTGVSEGQAELATKGEARSAKRKKIAASAIFDQKGDVGRWGFGRVLDSERLRHHWLEPLV